VSSRNILNVIFYLKCNVTPLEGSNGDRLRLISLLSVVKSFQTVCNQT
jgi:hypothetical protein